MYSFVLVIEMRAEMVHLRSTLHCTALHCTALHCTALHCTALHCTKLHCTALHCTLNHKLDKQLENKYKSATFILFPNKLSKKK
jgi:hypothetical protein